MSGMNPFIPSWLDDAGLTPVEFRVLCRILRRGQCFESLSTMAKALRVRRVTLQRAIKSLHDRECVKKQFRNGTTCILTVTPSLKEALGSSGTYPKRGTTPYPKRGTTHLDQKRHYKGTPSKVIPLKGGSRKIPLSEL